jgi:hypothetical protein
MKILTMDDFLKRIQSRLKYNGITASKAKCREAYCQFIPQENWNNPSADQILLVVQRLTEWDENKELSANEVRQETSYSQAIQEPLVSEVSEALKVSEVSEDLVKTMPQPETIEITLQDHPDIWEILQPAAEDETCEIAKPVHCQEQITPLNQGTEQAQLAKSTASNLPVDSINQPNLHQAISQAIYQLGVSNSSQTNQLLTVLANELSSDITDTQEMVTALVTAYLSKRQSLLSSAVGTIHSVRSAQTESFQSGLTEDFFDQKRKKKESFLANVEAMFN